MGRFLLSYFLPTFVLLSPGMAFSSGVPIPEQLYYAQDPYSQTTISGRFPAQREYYSQENTALNYGPIKEPLGSYYPENNNIFPNYILNLVRNRPSQFLVQRSLSDDSAESLAVAPVTFITDAFGGGIKKIFSIILSALTYPFTVIRNVLSLLLSRGTDISK